MAQSSFTNKIQLYHYAQLENMLNFYAVCPVLYAIKFSVNLTGVKAASRTLMKLSPDVNFTNIPLTQAFSNKSLARTFFELGF
jgi:hypothetical protein